MIGLGKSALSFRTRIRGMRSRRAWRALHSLTLADAAARVKNAEVRCCSIRLCALPCVKAFGGRAKGAPLQKVAALQNAMSDEPAGVRLHPGSKGLPGRCAGNEHTYHLRSNQESAAKGCGGIEFM